MTSYSPKNYDCLLVHWLLYQHFPLHLNMFRTRIFKLICMGFLELLAMAWGQTAIFIYILPRILGYKMRVQFS